MHSCKIGGHHLFAVLWGGWLSTRFVLAAAAFTHSAKGVQYCHREDGEGRTNSAGSNHALNQNLNVALLYNNAICQRQRECGNKGKANTKPKQRKGRKQASRRHA